MSLDLLVDIIHSQDTAAWAARNQQAFDSLFSADGRYPQRAREHFQLRAPAPNSDDSIPYAAYIHPENPTSGVYSGLSFVMFPVEGAPCLIGMVVGTGGLGKDHAILGRPGHTRKANAIARWLSAQYGNGELVAWAKHDPTRIDIPLPGDISQSLPDYKRPLDRYGSVLYAFYRGDRAATRARLRLPADATVFLHFGLIRGYKGLDLLLDAYRAARVPRKRLVIAGTWAIAAQGQSLGERLRMAWIRRWARTIRCEFRHVADDEIRDFMAAADAVVLAHRQVLNSGVAVLGMSFGKLVVGPDTGCVGPLLAEGVNERYPAGDTAGLARAMERAADPARIAAARVNATIARGWDWQRNAAAIIAALGMPVPDRQPVLVEVS